MPINFNTSVQKSPVDSHEFLKGLWLIGDWSASPNWAKNKQYVQDTRKDESVLEQAGKGIIRAPLKVAQGALSGPEDIAQGAMNFLDKTVWEWALNPILNTLWGAIKGDTYKPLPTLYNNVPSENQWTENVASNIPWALAESLTTNKTYNEANKNLTQSQYEQGKWQWIGGSLANIGGGIAKSAFNIMAPWTSAGFMAMGELPWAQYVPQALWAITQKPIDYLTQKAWGTEATAEQLGNIANFALPLAKWKVEAMNPTSTLWKMAQNTVVWAWNAILDPLGTAVKAVKSIPNPTTGVKQAITRDLPVWIIERDISLTPTERSIIENINGKPAWAVALEYNLPKGKQDMADALSVKADNAYNGITYDLKSIPERTPSTSAKEMLGIMHDEMSSSSILTRTMAPYMEKLQQLMQQTDYSLSEKNAIRRDFDRIVASLFDKQWRVSGAEDKQIANIRSKLSDEIQEQAMKNGIDIKDKNNILRTSIALRDGVLRRLSQENKNNKIWLQDIWVWAILWAWDPLTTASVIFWKKLIEDQAPWIAQTLYNINKNPYETRNMRRGVNISTRDTTNGFSIAPDNVSRVRGSEVLTTEKNTEIPWSRKTTVEVPMNPLGNQSKTLANKQGVIVEPKWETKLLAKPTNEQQMSKPIAGNASDILDTLPSKGTQNNSKLSPEQQKAVAESGKYHLVKNQFTNEIQWVPKKNAGLFGGIGAKEKPPEGYTGWFKWADGKMKFEIDDSKSKFEFPKRTTDKTSLEYGKASLDIADASNAEVSLMKELDGFKWTNNEYRTKMRKEWYDRMYDIKKWEYRIWDVLQHSDLYKQYPWLENTPISFHTEWGVRSAGEMTNWKISIAVNAKDPKSVILHEIQHIIQEKEWFSKGGNIEWKTFEDYKNSAWEVEARNVQSRMWMSPTERSMKSPESTEDVPRAKQIVRTDSKWPVMIRKPRSKNK
jgi:hypothetical protein